MVHNKLCQMDISCSCWHWWIYSVDCVLSVVSKQQIFNCFKLVHRGRGSIRVATSSENRFRNGKCDGLGVHSAEKKFKCCNYREFSAQSTNRKSQ